MSMKGKPDISDFSGGAKDVDAFLDGASADVPAGRSGADARKGAAEPGKPEVIVQKMFRLRWETSQALKAGALQETARNGRRVTETEIVERLIREHFGLSS